MAKESEINSRQEQEMFLLPTRFQTGSTAHPASYTIGTGGFFPEVKVPVAWG
jgi:hypothetical protein